MRSWQGLGRGVYILPFFFRFFFFFSALWAAVWRDCSSCLDRGLLVRFCSFPSPQGLLVLSTDYSFILVSICMETNGPVDIINKLELRIIICLY